MVIENPLGIKRRGLRQHVGPEKKFEQQVKHSLEQLDCEVEKLHGSVLQAGLPDLIVVAPEGKVYLIEIKYGKVASVGDVMVMLRGRQRSLIPLWGHRSLYVWLLCSDGQRYYPVHAGRRDFDSLLEAFDNLFEALRSILYGS